VESKNISSSSHIEIELEVTSKVMIAIKTNQRLKNRRKLERHNYRAKISFTVDGLTYRGLSSNFSLNGLLIGTHHQFSPGTLLEIVIHFRNDLTSRLKGKVVRASKNPPWGVNGTAGGYRVKGMGIEIIEKDSLYLHFIRWLISPDGEDLLGEFVFSEREEEYQKIKSELQEKCQLFDVFALLSGEQSKQAGFLGKAWFEAKITNNTDYSFTGPIVIFMTINNTQYIQNERGDSLPEIGIVLISYLDNVSYWKPRETIPLEADIDLLSKEVQPYELKFLDYLTNTLRVVIDEPINLDDYISTRWIGSPCLVPNLPVVKRTA
jgi:hypothetical protein